MTTRKTRRFGARMFETRNRRDWSIRIGLAAILLMIGYIGTTGSLANVVAKIDTGQAHAIAPSNAVISGQYAQDMFDISPQAERNSPAARLAQRAVLADPTAIEALTILGFQAQLRGDTARADSIFSYATRLSRRELRPQLWAIEEAVTRGDIDAALRNYDIALRTSKNAPRILFPPLASALSEPRIRRELLGILETRPAWEEGFIDYASSRAIEPRGTLALLTEEGSEALRVSDDMRANLVNVLVTEGEIDSAWGFYRSFRDGVRRNFSRDPKFSLQAGTRTDFDWRIGDETGLAAAILNENEVGLLDFSIPPQRGGTLVSQTQLLPPGRYILRGLSDRLGQYGRAQPYWTLTCQNGKELGRVEVSASATSSGRFTGLFVVPSACPVQTLSLNAGPTDDIMGISGQIREISLRPAP